MPTKEKNVGVPPRAYSADFSEISSKTPGFFFLKQAKDFIPPKPYIFTNYVGQGNVVDIPGSASKYADLDQTRDTIDRLLMGGAPFGLSFNQWSGNAGDIAGRLETRIQNELSSKIRIGAAALPVSIAETKETMSFIAGAVKDIAASFRALTRFQPTEAVNILVYGSRQGYRDKRIHEALADRWLGWSYGVKPLIQDVEGAALALAKTVTAEENKVMHFTSRQSDYFSGNGRGPANPVEGANFVRVTAQATLKGRGDVWAEIADVFQQGLHEFGFQNFAGAAWEVIPYSFVVDWFLPIGEWLSSFTPPNNLLFKGGCVYLKCDKALISRTSGQHKRFSSSASIRSSWRRRRLLSSWPQFRLPPLDMELSLSQLASAVSLLIQGTDTSSRGLRV